MEVTEEEWLTTGQAAKVAARDIRTVRRWVDEGRLKARVSPYGHRQIALSSLLDVQRPTRGKTPRSRRRGQGRVFPPDCLEQWAETTLDWDDWRPQPLATEAVLHDLLNATEDLEKALGMVRVVLVEALASRPISPEGGGEVLDWLRTIPSSSKLPASP